MLSVLFGDRVVPLSEQSAFQLWKQIL